MHTFKVVKEPFGWAVRLGEVMSTPFWSRELAVREANCLCEALRRHGQPAQVVVEQTMETGEPVRSFAPLSSEGLKAFWAREAVRRR